MAEDLDHTIQRCHQKEKLHSQKGHGQFPQRRFKPVWRKIRSNNIPDGRPNKPKNQ